MGSWNSSQAEFESAGNVKDDAGASLFMNDKSWAFIA